MGYRDRVLLAAVTKQRTDRNKLALWVANTSYFKFEYLPKLHLPGTMLLIFVLGTGASHISLSTLYGSY